MRILMACAAFPPYGRGGGPAGSELLAETLAARGHEVQVVSVGDQPEAYVREDGVAVEFVAPLNIYRNYYERHSPLAKLVWHALENFNPRAFFAMRRQIARHRPDLVMTVSTENINVATWAAAATARRPIAHVTQSYFLLCWRGSLFNKGANCAPKRCVDCRAASLGKAVLSQLVDGLVGETRFVVDRHRQAGLFRKARTRVIPGAVRKAPSLPAPSASPTLRVGYLGVHTPIKGLETLAAAAQALPRDADVEFLIAGDGEADYAAQLRAAFAGTRHRFLGWIDPTQLFAEVDVVVVPSIWSEPYGRASVEGAAFGVPAIVARSGGLPENLEDGVSGLVFEPGDAAMLAAHLARLASDRAFLATLRAGALVLAERYSEARTGAELEAFLTEVVEAHRAKSTQGRRGKRKSVLLDVRA